MTQNCRNINSLMIIMTDGGRRHKKTLKNVFFILLSKKKGGTPCFSAFDQRQPAWLKRTAMCLSEAVVTWNVSCTTAPCVSLTHILCLRQSLLQVCNSQESFTTSAFLWVKNSVIWSSFDSFFVFVCLPFSDYFRYIAYFKPSSSLNLTSITIYYIKM